MMEVVLTNGAITRAKLNSNCHHQHSNIRLFYWPDAIPVAKPTVSKHWMDRTGRKNWKYCNSAM